MTLFRINSLRQRLILFILLPVGSLLFLMGVLGYFYTRNHILEQWRDASVVKLQRAAEHVLWIFYPRIASWSGWRKSGKDRRNLPKNDFLGYALDSSEHHILWPDD